MKTQSKKSALESSRRWASRLLIFVIVFMTAATHISVVEAQAATQKITYGIYTHIGSPAYQAVTLLRDGEMIDTALGEDIKDNVTIPLEGYYAYGWHPYITNHNRVLTAKQRGTYTEVKSNPRRDTKITLTYQSESNQKGLVSRNNETTYRLAGVLEQDYLPADTGYSAYGSPFGTPTGVVAQPLEGYVFDGWYKGSELVSSSIVLTREDIDKFAKARYKYTANHINGSRSVYIEGAVTGQETVAGYYTATTFTAKFKDSSDVVLYHYSTDNAMGYVDIPSQNMTEHSEVSAVTATAKLGYHFVKWTDEAGATVSEENVLSREVIDRYAKDENGYKRTVFKAVFAEDEDITITYTVNNEDAGSVDKTSEKVAPATGTPVGEVTATAKSGYTFLYWTNTEGDIITYNRKLIAAVVRGNSWNDDMLYPELANKTWYGELVNVDSTYTAHFKKTSDAVLTFKTSSDDMGSVKMEAEALLSINQPLDKTTGQAEPITAVAKKGYKFLKWTNNKTNDEITTATLSAEDIDKIAKSSGSYTDTTFYAHFEESTGINLTFESISEKMGLVETDAKKKSISQFIEQGDEPIAVTAVANPGYEFAKWRDADGNIISDEATLTSDIILAYAVDEKGKAVDTAFRATFVEKDDIKLTYEVDDDMGELTAHSESIAPVTGTPEGSEALARAGYVFANWTTKDGAIVSTSQKLTKEDIDEFAKDSDGLYQATTFKANFTEDEATITYKVNDASMGTVSPTSDTLKVITGEPKQILATAKPGYRFVKWTKEDGSQIFTYETIVKSIIDTNAKDENNQYTDTVLRAVFEEKDAVAISYKSSDETMGSVDISSESVRPATGEATGEVTATANAGYKFTGWTVGGKKVSDDEKISQTIVIENAKDEEGIYEATTFVANFEEKQKVSIKYTVDDTSKGAVTRSSELVAPATGNPSGGTAEARSGYKFTKWTVNTDERWESTQIALTKETIDAVAKKDGEYAEATFTAHFEEGETVQLTFRSNNTDEGTVDKSEQNLKPVSGTPESVTATAKDDYQFVEWINDVDDTIITDSTISPRQIKDIAYQDGRYVPVTFTAHFAHEGYATLTYVSEDDKKGTVDKDSEDMELDTGTPEDRVATAKTGYEFDRWTAVGHDDWQYDESTLDSTTIINVAKGGGANSHFANTVFVAHFKEKKEVALTYKADDSSMGRVTSASESIRPVSGTPAGSTAIAEDGYKFDKWTNNRDNTEQSAAVLTEDYIESVAKSTGEYLPTTFVAHFVEDDDVTLYYESSDSDMGSVSIDSDDVAPVNGRPSSVTATAEAGYKFVEWTTNADENWHFAPEDGVLTSDKIAEAAKSGTIFEETTFVAHFEECDEITLSFSLSDDDAGELTATSIKVAPATGQASEVHAESLPGYHFVKWVVVRDNQEIEIPENHHALSARMIDEYAKEDGIYVTTAFKAYLEEDEDIVLSFESSNTDYGSVDTSEQTLAPKSGEATDVVAQAQSGYRFVNWTHGDGLEITTDETLVGDDITSIAKHTGIYATTTFVANFEEMESALLRFYSTDSTKGTVSPSTQSINPQTGHPQTVMATANSGYHFVDWTTQTNQFITDNEALEEADINDVALVSDEYVDTRFIAHFEEDADITINYAAESDDKGYVSRDEETIAPATGVAHGSTAHARLGYIFAGWYDENDELVWEGATYIPAKSDGVNVGASYTAKFETNTAYVPVLEVEKEVSTTEAKVGEIISYTITVTNAGYAPAEDVTVVDNIGDGLEYISCEPDSGVFEENTVTWTGQTLDAGESRTYTVNVEITDMAGTSITSGIATAADEATQVSGTSSAEISIQIIEDSDDDSTDDSTLYDSDIDGSELPRDIELVTYSFRLIWNDTVPTYRPNEIRVALERADTGEIVETRTLSAADRVSSDEWALTFEPHEAYDYTSDIVDETNSTLTQISTEDEEIDISDDTETAINQDAISEDTIDEDSIDSMNDELADTTEDENQVDDSVEEDTSEVKLATNSQARYILASSATPDSALDDELEDEENFDEDGYLLDGELIDDVSGDAIILDDTSENDTALSDDEPIEYMVEILTQLPDGYVASESVLVDETFEITLSRQWTAREISTSSTQSSTVTKVRAHRDSTTIAKTMPIGAVDTRYSVGTDGAWMITNHAQDGTASISTLTSLSGIVDTTDIKFMLSDGSYLTNSWAQIDEDKNTSHWYHFGEDGSLDTGWLVDGTGHWYYLSEDVESIGGLKTGWNLDKQDGRWYYLDETTGAMATGWKCIDSKWYYFAENIPEETWMYNQETHKWLYKKTEGDRPYGSMYESEITPDGYRVSETGELER